MERKAVVWISTILYTMISLAIIGMLLAVVQPKISQVRDSIIIDQTKQSLAKIDETILNVKSAPGMRLYSEIKLGKGTLTLSGKDNTVKWDYEAGYQYSELNRTIQSGTIYERTEQGAGDRYKISLSLNYSEINITVMGTDSERILQEAANPYRLWFENKGSYVDISYE